MFIASLYDMMSLLFSLFSHALVFMYEVVRSALAFVLFVLNVVFFFSGIGVLAHTQVYALCEHIYLYMHSSWNRESSTNLCIWVSES